VRIINKKEATIITAHTGILIGNFDEAHKYMEKIIKRPLYTHELAFESVIKEIREKSKEDFMNIKIKED